MADLKSTRIAGNLVVTGGVSASYYSGTTTESSSYAVTASVALTGGGTGTLITTGSTYPITASWANNLIGSITSASYAETASYALNGGGSGTTLSTGSTYPITASWAVSASHTSTSSYVSSARPLVATYLLSDAATIHTNGNSADHFRVTLGGNRTLARATSSYDGQRLSWEFIQDGAGTRTITLGTGYTTGSDFSVQLNQTASKRDFMTAMASGSGVDASWYVLGFVRGY